MRAALSDSVSGSGRNDTVGFPGRTPSSDPGYPLACTPSHGVLQRAETRWQRFSRQRERNMVKTHFGSTNMSDELMHILFTYLYIYMYVYVQLVC